MSIYIELQDHTRKEITPKMAFKLCMAWSERDADTLSQEQKDYLQTIKRIVLAPDEVFCFCRYNHTKSIPMKTSNLYVYECETCKRTYTTDIKPVIHR